MAANYDKGRHLRPQDIERWKTAARPLLPGPGNLVLDIGAGTGRFSTTLAEASGVTVIACEPSASMRAVCQSTVPDLRLVGGTAEKVPFRNAVFDAVWASQVIHHVDLVAFAAAMRRVLKPAGRLLLRGEFEGPQSFPLFRYFPEAWAEGSAATLSLAQIRRTLASAGFRQSDHVKVEQIYAESAEEFLDRARSRSLSMLAALPDTLFHQGLRAIERDVHDNRLPPRIVEHVSLVGFEL